MVIAKLGELKVDITSDDKFSVLGLALVLSERRACACPYLQAVS